MVPNAPRISAMSLLTSSHGYGRVLLRAADEVGARYRANSPPERGARVVGWITKRQYSALLLRPAHESRTARGLLPVGAGIAATEGVPPLATHLSRQSFGTRRRRHQPATLNHPFVRGGL